jgi:MFS family permease
MLVGDGRMNLRATMNNRRSAYVGIALLGIVSLIGDIVYEGSRGLVPEYLKFLGATALVVGLVGGLGDFLGYGVRLVSGFLVDATRAYWFFILLGYGLIVSIPLLGISTGLEMAVLFVLLERLGKALRAPARDTVLSVVSKDVGAGKAFGLHELLDQVGGMTGPLIVAALMLFSGGDYRLTFSLLFLPFLMLLLALSYTYKRIGKTYATEHPQTIARKGKLPTPFYVYTFAVLLNTVGLIPYTLILYKVSVIVQATNEQWIVPLIYFFIQGVDAPAALLSGYAYDRFGISVLVLPFVLSLFPPLLAMIDGGLFMLVLAAAMFGLVLGMQESIYRAAVSQLSPLSSRGTAYGIFNAAYGIGFLVSGGVYGALIDSNSPFAIAVAYVLVTQASAIVALLSARAKLKNLKKTLNQLGSKNGTKEKKVEGSMLAGTACSYSTLEPCFSLLRSRSASFSPQ